MKKILPVLGLMLLAGCVSPYEEGKSAADVPANIDAIYLQKVYIAAPFTKPGVDPVADDKPSKSSQEMLSVAKPSMVSQLTNFGYKVVEDSHEKADIAMKCGVYYAAVWPLANDALYTWCRVYDVGGTPLLKFLAYDERGVIQFALGPTTTAVAAKEARETIIKVVKELRKGTKAAPVHASAAKKEGV
ncbi:MAG TPA: hypothetical protein VFT64_09970 [Rickettsiales bacterium]|nr:hypothetical protein [Rickettsiales bacterium]